MPRFYCWFAYFESLHQDAQGGLIMRIQGNTSNFVPSNFTLVLQPSFALFTLTPFLPWQPLDYKHSAKETRHLTTNWIWTAKSVQERWSTWRSITLLSTQKQSANPSTVWLIHQASNSYRHSQSIAKRRACSYIACGQILVLESCYCNILCWSIQIHRRWHISINCLSNTIIDLFITTLLSSIIRCLITLPVQSVITCFVLTTIPTASPCI